MNKIFATLFIAAGFCGRAYATVDVLAKGTSFGYGIGYSQEFSSNTTASGSFSHDDAQGGHEAAGSYASIGSLGAYVNEKNVQLSDNRVDATAQWLDAITVTGVGQITLQFNINLHGAIDPGSDDLKIIEEFDADPNGAASPLQLVYQEQMLDGNDNVMQNHLSGQLTVPAGTVIDLRGYLNLTGDTIDAFSSHSGADFYHTADTYITVVTAGGGYISQSGHIYAAVPEPGTVALAFVGLTTLAAVRIRARRVA